MRTPGRPMTLLAALVSISLFTFGAAFGGYAQAMTSATSVDGTISAVNGNIITLVSADNLQKTVTIQPTTILQSRRVATLAEIQPGEHLAITSRRGSDGALMAVSINMFSPEIWDIVRKGQFPMTTGDTMTNAEVARYVQEVKGRVLTMTYPDGTSTITVPDGTPIHRLVTVHASDLAVGLHISARGTMDPDGKLRASTVSYDQPAKG
jgi:hypothetical protein